MIYGLEFQVRPRRAPGAARFAQRGRRVPSPPVQLRTGRGAAGCAFKGLGYPGRPRVLRDAGWAQRRCPRPPGWGAPAASSPRSPGCCWGADVYVLCTASCSLQFVDAGTVGFLGWGRRSFNWDIRVGKINGKFSSTLHPVSPNVEVSRDHGKLIKA